MKKINYENLGAYFKKKAENEFGEWYSDNTNDWEEDISRAENNAYYDEIENLYNCHLEVTKVAKAPLLIDFYVKYYDDNDCEYFIDEVK
ncbi:MAG: hypothetical protein NC483_00435 [Ruminococcus sp.]|nr:hypothetical protein [Ruminococcus sp.]